jgi:hypothetical protein
MLERLLSWWQGKLFVLVLLGFVATDFVITITLSAADATAHVLENPFVPVFLDGQAVAVTLLLIALLGGVFLRGFGEAIGIASASWRSTSRSTSSWWPSRSCMCSGTRMSWPTGATCWSPSTRARWRWWGIAASDPLPSPLASSRSSSAIPPSRTSSSDPMASRLPPLSSPRSSPPR